MVSAADPSERGAAALRRALDASDPDVLDTAIVLLRAADETPSVLANLGAALRTRYRWRSDPGDLDAAVAAAQRAAEGTEPGDPAAAGRLGTWGVALGDRFERAADPADLAASVAAFEAAVAEAGRWAQVAGGRAQLARQSANLAGALTERYRASRDAADLRRAVDLARAALAASATAADREAAHGNLADALHQRFRRDGDRADLDEAIAVTLPEDGQALPPRRLATLGVLVHARFVRTGEAKDLADAVAVLGAVEQVTRPASGAPPGADRVTVLGALGAALLDRFRLRGAPADLDAAIAWQRAALAESGEVDRAARLSNLGVALAARPERDARAVADVREALDRHAEAVALAGAEHSELAVLVANRAGALLSAVTVLHDDTGLAAAEAYRRAAELAAASPDARASYLAQQGSALGVHASRTGDADAALASVRLLRTAVELGGPDHRDHAVFCSGLGSALVRRYVRHGSAGDLAEAIAWHDRAVAGIAAGRVGAARWFAARAYALRLHAANTRRRDDVDAAVDAFRLAMDAEADAQRLPDLLAGLGSAFDLRRDTVEDATATVGARREAVRLADHGDVHRGPWLSDLANALRVRAELLGDDGRADLDEAHRLHTDAVAATPSQHPEYATVLSNLAGSHRDRYVHTGSDADLDAALDLLLRAAAAPAAPAKPRFTAAETAGRLAADTGRWPVAARAYAAAIDLLPAAAWRGADQAGREQPIRDARWLAAEAAAAALQLDEPARAMTLLERGRTVLWNQQTETGADLTALRRTAPELAERLDAARAVLDAPRESGPGADDARITAAAEWDAAVAALRARPDLADTVQPNSPASAAAGEIADGTVAIVVVSRYRRDVLLLDRDGPRVLPLTRLDLDELADHIGDYYRALGAVTDPFDAAERRVGERQLTTLLAWLGDAIVDPVLDVLTAGRRLWWCPTGPFSALPLHAAGSAPERAVASYTPTVAALHRALGATSDGGHMVGVTAARVRGEVPLPATMAELDHVAALLPAGTAFTRIDDATRDAVAAALREAYWAHLACHARQDLAQPSRAAFLLADGPLGLAEIVRRADRPAAGAYLSACQSALGGVDLADEALHLAAAMQYAGYRHVIATLWPVGDRPAMRAAEDVYTTLCADGVFRPDRSADAVHELMLRLRADDPRTPSRWAPFVHLGP